MAFQTGTKVDPRLMRADLSGFSRGTELAMAGIASAVSGYAKKKKEKQEVDLATEAFIGAAEGNPYLRGLFPEGELTSDNVKKAVKAMGAKNMMSFMMQTNLLQTKADVEGNSLKRQKQDLKGLGELLKAQGISDTGGQLEFDLPRKTKFSTGSGTRFGLEDTMTDPRLATLFETYGPLLQAQYPEQFGGVSASTNTYTEPTKVRGGGGVNNIDTTGFGYLGLE
tara:strand:+ start:196 stop:867 length:672 start_codon:yes stop_codon:yes gene_type:complete